MPKEENKDKKEDKNLEKRLEECREERDEYLEGWKRSKADFLNYKKEEEERLEKKIVRRQENVLNNLITVLDSFDLSLLSSDEKKIDRKGVELIRNQLFDALRKAGLEKINVNPGDEFDPSMHEAVERIESDHPVETVVEETEKGYKYKDRVLRPSKVKVSKGQKSQSKNK